MSAAETARSLRRAVVTGAGGFLGFATVQALAARGVQVFALVRPQSVQAQSLAALPGVTCVRAALEDFAAWQDQIGAADTFFHFAWRGVDAAERGDETLQRANSETALALLPAVREIGCERFLFAGSQAEYGPVQGAVSESTPCCPALAYGREKLRVYREGAPLARALGIEYLHLRIFSVYGPGEHATAMIPQCLKTLQAGGVMQLSAGTQAWNYLHVSDAAQLFCALAACPLQGYDTVNVASADTRALRDFTEVLRKAAGAAPAQLCYAPQGTVQPVGIAPNVARLTDLTGYTPQITFEEGARQLAALYSGTKGEHEA